MKRFSYAAYMCLVLSLMVGCQDNKNTQSTQKRDLFAYTIITTDTQDSQQNPAQNLVIEVLDQSNDRLVFYPSQNNNTQNNDPAKSIFDKPKPTIVLFTQDDCKNCLTQAPYIVQLKEKYPSQIDLLILNTQTQTNGVDEILKTHYKSYPIYTPNDSKNLVAFLNKDISQGYLALFDEEGNKVIDYVGLVPPEMLERDILFLIHDTELPQANPQDSAQSVQESGDLQSSQE